MWLVTTHSHDPESEHALRLCTLCPWLSKTTRNTCPLSYFQWVRTLGAALLNGFSSESLGKLQSGCQQEFLSSEGLTGAGGAASNVSPSHDWHRGDGWWQEASILSMSAS